MPESPYLATLYFYVRWIIKEKSFFFTIFAV